MRFDKSLLTKIANEETVGDISPYSDGDWQKVDSYLRGLVGRISDIKTINVKADFNHYGSGFSSYIPLLISKKDRSDTTITIEQGIRTETTNGIILYLCRMAPVAIYGEGLWETSYKEDKRNSSFGYFLDLDKVKKMPKGDWSNEISSIIDYTNQFSLTILTKSDISMPIDFDISIPTVLTEPPFKLFDCLFYWMD